MQILRHWSDTHCGAIYCSLGLLAASLQSLARLAAGKPTLQEIAPQCVSGQSLSEQPRSPGLPQPLPLPNIEGSL